MYTDFTYSDIAKMIDHSLLNPALTVPELEAGCQLALRYDVASVCILPYYAARCAQLLAGSYVHPSTTIGFPHGGHTTAVKLAEVEHALKDGATELDMVINISQARSGNWHYVESEIRILTEHTHAAGSKIKVIFENAYLDDAAKIRLCEICGDIGVDWVKTSTGYASSGATHADLELMRRHSPPTVQVKAAGGMRTLDALARSSRPRRFPRRRHPHRRDARRMSASPRTFGNRIPSSRACSTLNPAPLESA